VPDWVTPRNLQEFNGIEYAGNVIDGGVLTYRRLFGVVIPVYDDAYVLQLHVYGVSDDRSLIDAAAEVAFAGTTIGLTRFGDPLSEGERAMNRCGLNEWGATARRVPLPMIAAMGFSAEDDYGDQVSKLFAVLEVSAREADLDDRSVGLLVFLTELSFISDLVGSGVEFSVVCQPDNPGMTCCDRYRPS
jgi:hypothetical protein